MSCRVKSPRLLYAGSTSSIFSGSSANVSNAEIEEACEEVTQLTPGALSSWGAFFLGTGESLRRVSTYRYPLGVTGTEEKTTVRVAYRGVSTKSHSSPSLQACEVPAPSTFLTTDEYNLMTFNSRFRQKELSSPPQFSGRHRNSAHAVCPQGYLFTAICYDAGYSF